MKKRYILIDSENVHNRLFEIIETSRKRDRILIFYTVHHSGKLEEYLKSSTKKSNIEFVECMSGDNALDLQLMGVLSYLIQRHPERGYVIYSKDKGYTTAVKHWQRMNVDVELISFIQPSVGTELFEFKVKKKHKKSKTSSERSPIPSPIQTAKTKSVIESKDSTDKKESPVISESLSIQTDNTEITSDANLENQVVSARSPATAVKNVIRRNPAKTDVAAPDTSQLPTTESHTHKMTNAEYIKEICKSVRSTDLALVNRVLILGFGTEKAKDVYAHFKKDEAYRTAMGKLYYPTKPMRLKSLIVTALRFNELDEGAADEICSIIDENGTDNLQSVYHSFIKRMPGNLGERQLIYKAVKPYLAVVDSL